MKNYLVSLKQQLSIFGRLRRVEKRVLEDSFDIAIKKSDHTQSLMNPKHQHLGYFHTCRSVIFLYHLSRTIYLSDTKSEENFTLAEKLFLLNRFLNSIDLFYKINMPDFFFINHSLGTVLSQAKYGNFFTVHQGVTVGVQNGFYPVFGERVVLFPNSVVVGNSVIGDNSVIGAGTVLVNKEIPRNSIVFTRNGALEIKDHNGLYDPGFFRSDFGLDM